MAKLSAKQQTLLERKWAYEAEAHQNFIAIAKDIRGRVIHQGFLKKMIDRLEEQVPESAQNAWDEADIAHMRSRSEAEREAWLTAYAFLERLSK